MERDPYQGLVSRLDFCRQFRIRPRTAWNWRRRGYGPQPRRVGSRLYYVQAEIDAFMAEVKARPSVVA